MDGQDPESDGAAQQRLRRMLARPAEGRDFLADAPVAAMTLDGQTGMAVMIRLTSYRALPLSCIASIELSVDGARLDLAQARLGLSGVFHPLSALGGLSTVWWFVLDAATLFVPCEPPPPGFHTFSGALCTIEPYITAGRFAFYNGATRRLDVTEAPR